MLHFCDDMHINTAIDHLAGGCQAVPVNDSGEHNGIRRDGAIHLVSPQRLSCPSRQLLHQHAFRTVL